MLCVDDFPDCEVWDTVTTCGVGNLFCATGSLATLLFACRVGVTNLDGPPVAIACTDLP